MPRKVNRKRDECCKESNIPLIIALILILLLFPGTWMSFGMMGMHMYSGFGFFPWIIQLVLIILLIIIIWKLLEKR